MTTIRLPKIEMVRRFFSYIDARRGVQKRREAGRPWPWTHDRILQNWRFTNVRREDDRVTRWIRRWLERKEHWDTFPMMLALARFVNWPPTLQEIGFLERWDPRRIKKAMNARKDAGEKVWTGAYMVHGGYEGIGKIEHIVDRVLTSLHRSGILHPQRLKQYERLYEVHDALCRQFGISDFMAQEISQDLVHTLCRGWWPDEKDFAAAGPGAQRGLARIFGRPLRSRVPQRQALEEMQLLRTTLNMLRMQTINAVPELTVHDVEFNLCEFDKYERVRLGQGTPRTRYTSPLVAAVRPPSSRF